MKRTFVAATAALLVIALGSVGGSSAAAAPPTAPWSGSAGGEVASLTTTAVGLNLADLGVAVSDAEAGSTLTPRANSVSSNVSADVAGLGIAVVSNDQSAPPDAGAPEVSTLLGVTVPTLLDIGAFNTTNEAHWDLDTACVTDGVLSASTTQTAGIDLLPLLGNGVLSLGVSQSEGQASLVQNTGLNYGVESVASGTITGLSVLGGAVTVDILGETTLTATATGTSVGTVEYTPATVTVNTPTGDVVLSPGSPTVTVNVALVGDVTITLNTPDISTTATSASATSSLLTVDVSLLLGAADVSVDILPLNASATAPAGGIDCPPAPPVIITPTEGATTSATPEIAGTSEPDATVEVFIDGSSIGTTTADGTGNWSITPATPLAAGAHAATAIQTVAGTPSEASAPRNFSVDLTAPPAPSITSPANGSSTNDTTPPISGTAEADSTVEVFVDGTTIGTTPADGTGDWTITPATPLAETAHTAVATATDAAGNVSPDSNTVTFTIDTTAPPAPVITSPANGSSTNDTTPPITGTAEANSTVEVFVDAVSIGTTPADGTGNWTITPTTPLAPGAHTAVATSTDAAGNVSPDSDTVTFTVDLTAPPAPVITSPSEGETVGDNTPDIVGTAEADAAVAVFIDGVLAGSTTADGSGDWTFTPTIPLGDGGHTVFAVAADEAGNIGPASTTVNFIVDTGDPAAPIITAPANGSTVSDTTPDIVGTAEAGATVEVFIDGAPIGTDVADGTGSWTVTPVAPLAEGPHTALATATDAAGNVSLDSNTVTFTIDTVAPAAPVITSPANGSTTNDPTPPIVGTAEADSTVEVTIDGVVVGTTTADGEGDWTFTPTTSLADGAHTATAIATDAAGNSGPVSNSVTFTVDATGPAAPVITAPANGSSTTDTTPPVTGTAEPGSTVTVRIDGVVAGTTTADGSGGWTFTPTTPLTAGTHTVTATATDSAGNVSPTSNTVSFTISAAAVAGGGLPATGGSGMLLPALLGSLLVALGAVVFAARRRRA